MIGKDVFNFKGKEGGEEGEKEKLLYTEECQMGKCREHDGGEPPCNPHATQARTIDGR